jgi:hypothetical protein
MYGYPGPGGYTHHHSAGAFGGYDSEDCHFYDGFNDY